MRQTEAAVLMANSLIFACACGKRLKAGAELAGKPIRCPQCGARLRVPGDAPEPDAENESPFVIDLAGHAGAATNGAAAPAEESSPETAPLTFPWLTSDAPTTEPAALAPAILIPLEPPIADQREIVSDFVADTPENPATIDELIQPDIEPIRATASRGGSRPAYTLPPGLREPWYLGWVEGLARLLSFAAIFAIVVVPALFLVGGLVALARTGNPRALLETRLGRFGVFQSLFAATVVIVVSALAWAAPFLLIIDLWRRGRALNARLESWLDQASRTASSSANLETDSTSKLNVTDTPAKGSESNEAPVPDPSFPESPRA